MTLVLWASHGLWVSRVLWALLKKSMFLVKMLFMSKILTNCLVGFWECYTRDARIEISSILVSTSWHMQRNAGASIILWTRSHRQNNVFSYKWNELSHFLSLFTCVFLCFVVYGSHHHVMYAVLCCVGVFHSCRQRSTWSMLRVSTAFLCLLNSCVFLPAEEI